MITILFLLFVMVYARPNLYHTYPTYYNQFGMRAQPNLFHNIKSQFHTQNEFGQYSYGYNDGLSSKIESKTADGVTHGSYAYIDSNGIVQNVNYISDDVNGFRVSGSNLPTVEPVYEYPAQEEILPSNQPEVIVSPTEMKIIESVPTVISRTNVKAEEKFTAKNATERLTSTEPSTETVSVLSKTGPSIPTIIPAYSTYDPLVQYSYYPNELGAISMGSLRMQNVAALSPVYSQFHSQDELGQYSYGYSGGPSSKIEMKTLDGITRGGYSYVDANGILQRVNYISDPINGFRVHATNFPLSNIAPASYYPAEYQLPRLSLASTSRNADESD